MSISIKMKQEELKKLIEECCDDIFDRREPLANVKARLWESLKDEVHNYPTLGDLDLMEIQFDQTMKFIEVSEDVKKAWKMGFKSGFVIAQTESENYGKI